METQNAFKFLARLIAAGLFGYVFLSADPVYAISAEYKCTSQCTLCIDFGKKIVCSAKYEDDSEDYDKGRKLSRFVNEGLIVPTSDLKQDFSLDGFSQKFFNCEFMVKKVEQIKEATVQMCVRKTVQYKKSVLVPRIPASTGHSIAEMKKKKSSSRERDRDRESSRDSDRESSRESNRESARESRESQREPQSHEPRVRKPSKSDPDLDPPPKEENMDNLINQMDSPE